MSMHYKEYVVDVYTIYLSPVYTVPIVGPDGPRWLNRQLS